MVASMDSRSPLRGSAPEPQGVIALGTQEGQEKRAAGPVEILPLHRPPAAALGSLPSVALSSGQAIDILPGKSEMR
jgi:hypothetical protein